MIRIRITREDIKVMRVGKTYYFTLPDEQAVKAARVVFSQMKDEYGMDFERVPVDNHVEPFTIAYKRIK